MQQRMALLFVSFAAIGASLLRPMDYASANETEIGNQLDIPSLYGDEDECEEEKGGGPNPDDPDPGDPAPFSEGPSVPLNRVLLKRGSVVMKSVDVGVCGPTFGWSHSRTYDSALAPGVGDSSLDLESGEKWFGGLAEMYIRKNGDDIELYVDASTKRTFTWNSGSSSYDPPFDYNATLEVKNSGTANEIYELTHTDTGVVFVFSGLDPAVIVQGQLKERTDVYGLEKNTYTRNSSGHVTSVAPASGLTVSYTYISGGSEDGRLDKIEVKDGTKVIKRVEYTYFGETDLGLDPARTPHNDLGSDGDLVQVKVSLCDSEDCLSSEDDDVSIVRYTQYRYYTGASAHKLKAVYSHEAIERVIGRSSLTSADEILEKADSYDVTGGTTLAEFATQSFTYYTQNESTSSADTVWSTQNEDLNSDYGGTEFSESGRVKTFTTNQDCQSCGGGAGAVGKTRRYFYLQNGYTTPQHVNLIVIEDTEVEKNGSPTGVSRTVYGINSTGAVLRRAFTDDPSGTKIWCNSIKVDSDNRITERRTPEAHTVVDAKAEIATFLDWSVGTNDDDTLADSGLIYLYSINSDGYRTSTKIKDGKSGTAYMLGHLDYGDGSTGKPKHYVTASYVYPDQVTSVTDSSRIKTEYDYVFVGNDNERLQERTTTLPDVSSDNNGPYSDTELKEYFDSRGRLRWRKNGEDRVAYYSYHPDFGGRSYVMEDVDADATLPGDIQNGDNSGSGGADVKWIAWGSSTPPDGFKPTTADNLELVTKQEYDCLCRSRLTIDTGGALHYTAYEEDRISRFRHWDTSSDEPALPFEVRRSTYQYEQVFTVDPAQVDLDSTGAEPVGIDVATVGTSSYQTWTRRVKDDVTGVVESVERYIDAGANKAPTTTYRYTPEGYRYYAKSPDGTIRYTKFDEVGRRIEIWMGTDDTGGGHDDPDGSGTPNNMKKVAEIFYDDADGTTRLTVGNGNATKTISHASDTQSYTTESKYDWRDQLEQTRGEDDLATKLTRDFMGRVTKVQVYADADTDWEIDGGGTYELRSQSERVYDERGNVFREIAYKVDDATPDVKLTTNHWYNRSGAPIKAEDPNGLFQKTKYDGVGRPVASYVSYDDTESSSGNVTDADDVTDDTVIRQEKTYYDNSGNVWLVAEYDRNDGTTGTGELTVTTAPKARPSYTVRWFESDADRLQTAAFYGTNGGEDLSGKGGTNDFDPDSGGDQGYDSFEPTPNSSDNIVVTKYEYHDTSGRLTKVTDNRGVESRFEYDDLGQQTKSIENYANGTVTETDTDTDRVVEYLYSQTKGTLTGIKTTNAKGSGEGTEVQTTHYRYDSALDRSWVTDVAYPEEASGVSKNSDNDITSWSPSTDDTYTYDRLGREVSFTDQRGVVHDYTYGSNGRVTEDYFSNHGSAPSGVDTAVVKIAFSYDDVRRLEKLTSWDGAGTPAIVNEIERTYSAADWGLVTKSEQSHNGGTSGDEAQMVKYTYEESVTSGEAAYVRLDYVTHPDYDDDNDPMTALVDGRKVYYNHSEDSGIGERVNRLDNIAADGTGMTKYAQYDFFGVDNLYKVDHPEVTDGLTLDYDIDSDDTYKGFDRFGRIVETKWSDSSGTIDHFKYAYDRGSNQRYKENLKKTDRSELYHEEDPADLQRAYDGLSRLVEFHRGTLDNETVKDSIQGTPGSSEIFGLDALGNWSALTLKTSGTTDLAQARDHNADNEIETISETTGPTWIDPGYDASGNMTEGPTPGAETTRQWYVYDAWNRLVEVWEDDGDGQKEITGGSPDDTNIAQYEYDALHRRVVRMVGGATLHYFYNEQWQVVEVRADGVDIPYERYIWHPHYVDALAVRFYDANSDGSGIEEHYYVQDANFNVTSVVKDNGDVLERYQYSPYGEVTVLDDDWTVDPTGDIGNEVLYTGRRLDSHTGLYHYRYRDYSPALGRFLRRDPLGVWGTRDGNMFLYAGSRPTTSIDPSGLEEVMASTFNFLITADNDGKAQFGVNLAVAGGGRCSSGQLQVDVGLTLKSFGLGTDNSGRFAYDVYGYLTYLAGDGSGQHDMPIRFHERMTVSPLTNRFKVSGQYSFGAIYATGYGLHPQYVLGYRNKGLQFHWHNDGPLSPGLFWKGITDDGWTGGVTADIALADGRNFLTFGANVFTAGTRNSGGRNASEIFMSFSDDQYSLTLGFGAGGLPQNLVHDGLDKIGVANNRFTYGFPRELFSELKLTYTFLADEEEDSSPSSP